MTGEIINHLWQSTVFAILAGVLTLAFRRNRAQVRYWLWFSASVKFLIPFALLLSLGGRLGRTPAAKSISVPAAIYSVVQVAEPVPVTPQTAPPAQTHTDWIPLVAACLWACGFAVVALVRLRGWLRIRSAVRASTPLGLPFPIPVRSSPHLLEPGVVGIVHPVLLLPATIVERLAPNQLQSILAHELCHVRRRDNLTAAIHMLVEALFWFHPFIWWISARLLAERERACDEAVLELGSDPQVYAESIVKTCQYCVESPLTCVSGITGADLKKRIVRIMTLARVGNLSFVKKVLLVAVSVAVVAVPVLLGVLNAPEVLVQEGTGGAGPLPSFEVASIRPGDPNGEWNFNGGMGNRLEAPNITPMRLILIAYDIDQNQLYALPPWAKSEKFTIRAVGPPEMAQPPGPQRFELMRELVQSLLADRFSLKVHRATKQLPVYDLVIAKHGPKLKPMSEADFPAVHVKFAPNISMIHGGGSGADVHLTALGAPISLLATELTRRYLGRTVIDKTGLTGRYDFDLTWTRSLGELARPAAEAGMSDATAPTPPPDSSGPSIFTAIQEQLGLKLKPTKGPVEVLVIDHIEMPSEN